MAQGASKLFTMVGAGYAGALLCNNAELATDFASKVARSVLHSVAKADAAGKAYPELGSSSDESLRRLSAEVAALAALVAARGSSSHTVAHGSGSSSNALLLGGVVVVGSAAVLRMRGLDNLLYVSRASFRQGVSTLGAGLQSVSVAIARVKSALSERIDGLAARVGAVATDVEATRAGVESLGEQLSAVEVKLDGVSQKQDFACRGVYLLCSAVNTALQKESGSPASSDARDASKKPLPGTDKSLLEMLAAPSGGCESVALAPPLTGTWQEQLAAISTLAAVNLNMSA